MDRRIETKVVETEQAALTTIINKDPSEVWWITVSPTTMGTVGVVKIYDGFDAGGKLRWIIEAGYSRLYPFIPPIPCDQGITVYSDTNVASYTIGYRPFDWPRG